MNDTTQQEELPTTIGHTTTHGRIDVYMLKIERTDGSAAIPTAILEASEDDQCWSKHVRVVQQ
jgi:hypothetical protein